MIKMSDIPYLLPVIILAASAIIVMLGIAVKRSHAFSYGFTLVGLVAAFISLNGAGVHTLVTPLFIIDGVGSFMTGLILCASFVITLFSFPYFKIQDEVKEEYYILLLLATLGSVCMVISNHFISFVLSLEVLSVSLFALIGYLKHKPVSIEAGIKYLIMAAVATGFLLFGFALIYAGTGRMDLQGVGDMLRGREMNVLVLSGLAMSVVGFGFKMALTPFHLWTPDIYSAATTPVSTFVATVSKGAAFIFLLRLFYVTGGLQNKSIWIAFAVIATASMFLGNWLALRQNNVKRLLAYSSISHLGYLMVAFLSFSEQGMRAAIFYLVVYFVSMMAAFGTVNYLTHEKGEPLKLEDYKGMFWTRPWLAALFTVAMLSLAGIPLTAGFLGKFYILASGMGSGILFLLIVLIVSSTIGLFYYLRVVAALFSGEKQERKIVIGDGSYVMKIVMVVLFVLLIGLGVYPNLVLDALRAIGTGG